LCHADGEILFDRFKERIKNNERHEGHADADNLDEWAVKLKIDNGQPLDIKGEILEIDTTHFTEANDEKVRKSIQILKNN
jgi:hypothetical protein